MKITFDSILKDKTWLNTELLHSLDGDDVSNAADKREYDVKLLVNGREIEPKLFNELLSNLECYINEAAAALVNERLESITDAINDMQNTINDASCDIKDKVQTLLKNSNV